MIVYFIQCGPGGPIKIGTTRDVKKRMGQLQTGQPYSLELLATMPGNVTTEQRLHLKLNAHRMTGEWFEPHEDVLAEVRRAQPTVVPVAEDRRATAEEMDRSWRMIFIGLLKNSNIVESAIARMCGVTVDEVHKWNSNDVMPTDEAMANIAQCLPLFAQLMSARENWDKDTPEGENFRAEIRRFVPLDMEISPFGKTLLSQDSLSTD